MPHLRAGLLAVVMAVGLATAGLTPPAVAAEDPRELQARRLYAKGEYDAALDLYATLFAESGDPLFLRNIGRCNQKLEHPDKAISAFRDYLQRGRKLSARERQEIETYIKEMEGLKARQAREREKPIEESSPPAPGFPPGRRPRHPLRHRSRLRSLLRRPRTRRTRLRPATQRSQPRAPSPPRRARAS